jgi:hypothetical protein
VSVVVTCTGDAKALSFTAYAVGAPKSVVHGTCTESGATTTPTQPLRLPSGGNPARVRVRVRPGPGAGTDPINWNAGVYGD